MSGCLGKIIIESWIKNVDNSRIDGHAAAINFSNPAARPNLEGPLMAACLAYKDRIAAAVMLGMF